MKLEREKDIPAFQGKSRSERSTLRREAFARDRSLVWISCLGGAMMGPILALSGWVARHFGLQSSWLPFIGIYLALAIPFLMLFRSLFITPRVRKALEAHEKIAG